MEFAFAVKGPNLCVSVNGQAAGTVRSEALCGAMLDTYLDDRAVSPDAKASILQGLAASL